ncbi:DUF421 domain-containing protein [Gelidibacter salicanalis]|nr:YetF domain-containing protein [Gelidibacter salicanalis]
MTFHMSQVLQIVERPLNQALNELFALDQKTFFLILLSTVCIYVAVILYTRIFGKRSFSKMSSFDFAMTVAVGSMIASTVLSDSVSFLEGAVGLLVVYSLQLAAAFLRRFPWFRKLTDNEPTLLMDGQTLLRDNMKAVRVTEGDIRSKLREANVIKMTDIKAVIFETTGDIVVLHKNGANAIDDWLLKDVQR